MPNYHTEQDQTLDAEYRWYRFRSASNIFTLGVGASLTYVETLQYFKEEHFGRPVFLGACALGTVWAGLHRRRLDAESVRLNQKSVELFKSGLSIEAAHLALDSSQKVFDWEADEAVPAEEDVSQPATDTAHSAE